MANQEYVGKMVTVADWFRRKQIFDEGISNYPEFGDVTRETERAVLIVTDFGKFWVPKKCVTVVA